MTEQEMLYARAITRWGAEAQMDQTIEECAELILAIRHYRRDRISLADVVEEIADVEIMCEQLRLLVGTELVDDQKTVKQERLRKRLESGEELKEVDV